MWFPRIRWDADTVICSARSINGSQELPMMWFDGCGTTAGFEGAYRGAAVKGLLVAGTASGVGKTTVALLDHGGTTTAGQVVQPFKCGPDFLDTGHHTRVCGRVARNLDTWMLTAEANQNVLRDAALDADVLVVEGMMGLFDGKSGDAETGSTAEIAKLLKLPVVLVVDAAKSARSIAALVLGFEMFDPELQLAGVILNRVGSEHHFRMLETAIKSSCKTRILGWLPNEPKIAIPERHLGLYGAAEAAAVEIGTLAELAETHLDLDALFMLECELEPPVGGRAARAEAAGEVAGWCGLRPSIFVLLRGQLRSASQEWSGDRSV